MLINVIRVSIGLKYNYLYYYNSNLELLEKASEQENML